MKWQAAARKVANCGAGSGMFICVTSAGIRVSEEWQWQAIARELVRGSGRRLREKWHIHPHDQCGHPRERDVAVAGSSGRRVRGKWQWQGSVAGAYAGSGISSA